MKLLTVALIACLSAVVAPQVLSQENRLHLTRFFPESSPGRVELTASTAQRDFSSSGATILHLSGNVEVRVITCGPEEKGAVVCDRGSVVLHADAVDFNEKTGEFQPSGNVHVVPYQEGSMSAK
jgi:sugar/nucleoside kinase (ribokinase family)